MIRSVFRFKARSPERDRQTDTMRFERIREVLDAVSDEMDREKAGFEKRYGTVAADAAFLFEALENEASSGKDSGRMADLTNTLQACERRIASLKKQILLMEECRQIVRKFVEDNDSENGRPAKGGMTV